MLRSSRRRLVSVAGSVGLLALGSAWVAAQSGPGTTNALIPYQGHLELDGEPVDTPVDLRVGLFTTDAANVSACLASASLTGCGVWADELANVDVNGGAFSVLLGSGSPLPDEVFASDALYVGIAVASPGGAFVTLNGVQRVASVPYAVRTETGKDLFVSGSLQVRDDDNDAAPDIATFYANNLTRGVAIGYDRVAAVGTATSQDLVLAPKNGDVYVEGGLDVRDGIAAIQNRDGAESIYYRDGGRYLVQATYQPMAPTRRWVAIPETVLESYCGDEDGCTVRLGMRDYQGGTSSSTSMGPFSFFYGAPRPDNGRHWRRAETVTTTNAAQSAEQPSGIDGDNAVAHVARDHDCYFTDGFYMAGGGGNDSGRGMGLLNWNADAADYTPTCWLTIDD